MPLVAQLLIALGIDARWVLGIAIGLIVGTLLVVVIVIESVATVLTGAYATSPAQATNVATTAVIPGQLSTGGPLPIPAITAVPGNGDLATRVVELVQTWLGVPYAFGGCSHAGVDCSCLVQNVYAALGVRLPRVAVDQFNATAPVADPEPGDLVFFANTYEPGISHVGIYIGNGMQINAPTTGQVVSVAPVFTGYWGSHYAGAHRVRG